MSSLPEWRGRSYDTEQTLNAVCYALEVFWKGVMGESSNTNRHDSDRLYKLYVGHEQYYHMRMIGPSNSPGWEDGIHTRCKVFRFHGMRFEVYVVDRDHHCHVSY